MLVSPAVGAETDMCVALCVCVCVFPARMCFQHTSRWTGFKMLYADRGSSHNMNHLVTTAELEMSRLISVPHASVAPAPFTSLATELKGGLD